MNEMVNDFDKSGIQEGNPETNKPEDTLSFPYACDLGLCSFGDARDLLIEYFGGDENLHYLLRIHVKAKSAVETEITHFYPQVLLDTTDQDDIDDWELVGFRFNDGKFWHKTVWVEGA